MNSLNVHRVERINVRAYEAKNTDGEPYQVIKIKVVSEKYGNIEITAFGIEEESIAITYGSEI